MLGCAVSTARWIFLPSDLACRGARTVGSHHSCLAVFTPCRSLTALPVSPVMEDTVRQDPSVSSH